MKKAEIEFVSRGDIFWACFDCKMIMTEGSQEPTPNVVNEIANLNKKVTEMSGDLKKYQESTKTWAETLFGQDFKVYDPNISTYPKMRPRKLHQNLFQL